MPSLYDISVPILNGGIIYPGNPPISITPQQEISKGAGANVSALAFGSHTATHVDAPKHFFDDGAGVEKMPLDLLMGPAIVIDVGNDAMAVGKEQLERHEIAGHTRVLIKTRNSGTLPGKEFIKDYTYLAPDGAAYLVALGVKLVGVDYLSVE
ncbi:MAG TPA: cyclase family protein, partial [Gemmatimonadaceae bacterium]|nr:cyclase family protein [Gemmatimonadaceae bacterium]